jgi:hypothetical protein
MSKNYVDLGPMSVIQSNVPEAYWGMASLMRETSEALINQAEGFTTKKPAGKYRGFHLDGTLESLTITSKGNDTTVKGHIKMLVADYPKKTMFGFPTGSAKVTGSSSANSVRDSVSACVQSIVEGLVAKSIQAMRDR